MNIIKSIKQFTCGHQMAYLSARETISILILALAGRSKVVVWWSYHVLLHGKQYDEGHRINAIGHITSCYVVFLVILAISPQQQPYHPSNDHIMMEFATWSLLLYAKLAMQSKTCLASEPFMINMATVVWHSIQCVPSTCGAVPKRDPPFHI